MLLASDAVGAWIEEQAPTESDTLAGQAETHFRTLSQAQWEATFGPADKSRARYAAIGLATTTQSRVSRTGKALIQAGDEATLFVLKPLRRSRVLSPLRKGFNHLAEIGKSQIDRWAAIGRAREERSRAMTKATLNQIVTNSVTLLSDEPHVQVIVQEIVTSQSLGMTEEVIEEVRERAVTLDIRLEKIVRKTLRRPPRKSLPGPNFTLQIGAGQREAERLAGKSSLAGQYAGFASRLMALAIDLLIIIVGFSVAGTLITAVRSIFHIGPILAGIFGVAPASTWDSALAGYRRLVAGCGLFHRQLVAHRGVRRQSDHGHTRGRSKRGVSDVLAVYTAVHWLSVDRPVAGHRLPLGADRQTPARLGRQARRDVRRLRLAGAP